MENKLPVSRFHDLRFQPHPNFPGAEEVYDRMRAAPKFVFSRDVVDWLAEHSDEYANAAAVAIDAGRTELPYETMLIELDENSDERIFWLIDCAGGNAYRIWPAFHYPRANRSMVFADHFPLTFSPDGEAIVKAYKGSTPSDALRSFINSYAPTAAIALCLAMTLHVRGIITREPPPVNPKLDAARIKRGKPPITKDYVTVHIGYVTDRRGNQVAFEEGRGHVKPHVRSGHYRNQAVGPGRQDRRRIWIRPYLVNYGPDTAIVSPPQYFVVP